MLARNLLHKLRSQPAIAKRIRMSTSVPATMRIVLHDLSKSSLSSTTGPLPTPDFSKNQHLIKVLTVAPCAGELSWPRPEELNVTSPGVDAVGVVVTSPPTSSLKPGGRVYYRTQYPNFGSLREYSIATTAELALAPSNLSAIDAAAIPVSALTAWQGLFEQFKLPPPGSPSSPSKSVRLLVNGASGGVGLWVIQLAHAAGITTIGTCSPRNKEMVKQFGADELLEYTSTTPSAWVAEDPSRKVDFVFDAVGPRSLPTVWPVLKPNGRLLTIVPPANMDFAGYRPKPSEEQLAKGEVEEGVTGKFFIMHPDREQLGEISKLVEEGKCKPVVDSVYAFEDFEKAFQRADSGKAVGKVVIKVAEE